MLWGAERLAFWTLDAEKCRFHRRGYFAGETTLDMVPKAAGELAAAVTAAVRAVRAVRADLVRVSAGELPYAAGLTGDCAHGLALELACKLDSACLFMRGTGGGASLTDLRTAWLRLRPTVKRLSSADTESIVMLMRREAVAASQAATATPPAKDSPAGAAARPAAVAAADAEKLVARHVARITADGRAPATLTRDGIVNGLKTAGTPVSAGLVSGTKTWKQVAAAKGRAVAPPPKGEHPQHVVTGSSPGVESNVAAAIESGDMDAAIEGEDWAAYRHMQAKEERANRVRPR